MIANSFRQTNGIIGSFHPWVILLKERKEQPEINECGETTCIAIEVK